MVSFNIYLANKIEYFLNEIGSLQIKFEPAMEPGRELIIVLKQ